MEEPRVDLETVTRLRESLLAAVESYTGSTSDDEVNHSRPTHNIPLFANPVVFQQLLDALVSDGNITPEEAVMLRKLEDLTPENEEVLRRHLGDSFFEAITSILEGIPVEDLN